MIPLARLRVLTARHLRKELRGRLSAEQRKAVRSVLKSKADMDELVGFMRVKAEKESFITPPVGKLGDGAILKWLFEHRAEILAFVMEIIKLFKK